MRQNEDTNLRTILRSILVASFAVAPLVSIFATRVAHSQGVEFVGYYENATSGFDAALSEIEYQNPDPDDLVNDVSIWCMIDNMANTFVVYAQAGWRKEAGWTSGKHFIQYRVDGESDQFTHTQDFPGSPSPDNLYEVSRERNDLLFVVNAGVVHTRSWHDFNNSSLCRASFMAEPKHPDDHTPGSVSDWIQFDFVEVREVGKGVRDFKLDDNRRLQTTNGKASILGAASFKVWDKRDL